MELLYHLHYESEEHGAELNWDFFLKKESGFEEMGPQGGSVAY